MTRYALPPVYPRARGVKEAGQEDSHPQRRPNPAPAGCWRLPVEPANQKHYDAADDCLYQQPEFRPGSAPQVPGFKIGYQAGAAGSYQRPRQEEQPRRCAGELPELFSRQKYKPTPEAMSSTLAMSVRR